MAGEWFLARAGQQTLGPITAQQLKQLGAEGQVQATDLVWKAGMAKWAPAGQVKGLLTGSGEFHVAAKAPEPVGAKEVDWRTAGPPREAPELPAVPPEPGDLAPPPEGDEAADAEREPWYYGFLAKYAKAVLALGALVCVLGFVWVAVAVLARAGLPRDAAAAAELLLALLFGVLALALALLALAFGVALILLAVDAARNLRALRRKADRR